MRLYRPVGIAELELIAATQWRAFPPRLFHQPIFYPVLNFQYARLIAENWNTKDPNSGFAGFVTEFDVDDNFAARYEIRTVGSREARELWVPAEELAEFNSQLNGPIMVIGRYYGELFSGSVDAQTQLPTTVVAPSK